MNNPRVYVPAETCHTVYCHTAAWLLPEACLEQVKPVFHDCSWRGAAIIELPVLLGNNKCSQSTRIIAL